MATEYQTRHATEVVYTPVDVRAKTWWGSAAWAGIIAGIVFAMLEMFMVWAIMGMSFWGPLQMIAAMLMGTEVLPQNSPITVGIGLVGLMIHMVLSVIYGLVIGWMVHKMDMGPALLVGAVVGLVLIYFVNFYLIAPAVFPWFVQARNWISLLTHIVFGLVAAGAYIAMRNRHARR